MSQPVFLELNSETFCTTFQLGKVGDRETLAKRKVKFISSED